MIKTNNLKTPSVKKIIQKQTKNTQILETQQEVLIETSTFGK